MSSANANIAGRLTDYYQRQIAWLRESNAALDAMLNPTTEPDYDRWTAEDAERAKRLNDLVAEFSALKREWDGTRDVSTADHDTIRGLVHEVNALRTEFESRRVAATQHLTSTLDVLKGEAGDLRRGREKARKYGTGETDGGAIVDRRA